MAGANGITSKGGSSKAAGSSERVWFGSRADRDEARRVFGDIKAVRTTAAPRTVERNAKLLVKLKARATRLGGTGSPRGRAAVDRFKRAEAAAGPVAAKRARSESMKLSAKAESARQARKGSIRSMMRL